MPRLRLIVSGRIQFTSGTGALHITQLDKEAATAFLAASGVRDPYHLLSTNAHATTLDARWQPGIERYLFSAVDDVSGEAKQYLMRRLHVV